MGIPVRPFGRSGLSVPTIGFGVSGPFGAGLTAQRDLDRLVAAMIEAGAGFFDTAPFYGEAEKRLGLSLRAWPRERFHVATKAGTVRVGGQLQKRFEPETLRAGLHDSLRALGVEAVDLFILHGPAPEVLANAAVASALQAFKREGLALSLGVALRSAAELQAALATPWLDAIQAPLWNGPAPNWPEQAQAAGKGAIVIEAMRSPKALRWPVSPADLWYLARDLRNAASRAQSAAPQGLPADRLRAALSTTGVSCVLTTTTRLSHARANLAVASSLAYHPALNEGGDDVVS